MTYLIWMASSRVQVRPASEQIRMASEEEFKPKKNSSKTEEMVWWRKVVRENREKLLSFMLASLAG